MGSSQFRINLLRPDAGSGNAPNTPIFVIDGVSTSGLHFKSLSVYANTESLQRSFQEGELPPNR
jgi:hypothetical protein